MTAKKELLGESQYIEFKREIPKKREKFLKDIVAFANTSGGKIFLGVEDETGEVVGLGDQNPFKLSDAISNMASDACAPQIDMEITPKTIDDKTVLEIEIFPGRFRPYYLVASGKEKSTYIRVNGTSRPADARKLKELELEGLRISYDMTPEIGMEYDEELVETLMRNMYRTAINACGSEMEKEATHPLTIEKLEDFGVLCRTGRSYAPTRSFTLLTKPIDRNIKIQCAVFKGTTRDEFIDRKEFRGPIQNQTEEAYQFVLRHINRGAVIDGLYRRDHYELPPQSVRETIANACLHRSYLDSSSIQVSLYDDRLEVDSPGMLYDGLSVREATSGKSKCRNRAIAEAFHYMKLIEGWGTGLPRLFKQCQEMKLPEPKFEEFGDGIKTTIFRRRRDLSDPFKDGVNESNETNNESNESNNESNESNYLKNDEVMDRRILELLRKDSKVSQRKLAELLGVARSTIQRSMSRLEKDGLIRRVGGTRGNWVINQ